jgi:plastocyanin
MSQSLPQPLATRGGAHQIVPRGTLSRVRVWCAPRFVLAGLLLAAAATSAAAATLAVTVHTIDGKPLPGAVVTVHALDGAARPAPPVRAVMDQVDLAFAPDVLIIPVGSTVAFPNSDTTSHQVYSFSPAHPFQLPLYRGTPPSPERFDKVGVVTLGCNIHDNMLAYILVTDAPLFGRTDASGSWSTGGVSRGRYRLDIWHARLRSATPEMARELTVEDAERTEITVQLSKPLRPRALEGRPHSWDAY